MDARRAAEPITVHVTHYVKPGCEERFHQWSAATAEEARRFDEQFGGAVVFPPSETESGYHIVFRFSSEANLHRFWKSENYQKQRRQLDELVSEPPTYRYTNGLEHWFAGDSGEAPSRPPTYKMAVVVFAALLPLLFTIAPLVRYALRGLPPWLAQVIATGVVVLVMSYIAIPLMTRLFAPWLDTSNRAK